MRRPEIRVRLASVSDAAELVGIYGPYCTDDHVSFENEAPSEDVMAERIETTLTTHPWLVAADRTDPGDVLGYAYASRHRERPAYRWSVDVAVYVAAEATGRGVGRCLYDQLFVLLTAQRFHRAHAGIALPNEASVGLHRRCGFEPVGTYREVGYKQGAWRDVQWWSRALGTASAENQPMPAPPEPIPLRELERDRLAHLR